MKHRTPGALRHLEDALEDAARAGLRRDRHDAPTQSAIASFCSNDYLGLAGRPVPAASRGAGGSRLVVGDHAAHATLERASAALTGLETALVFASGYAANVGLLTALAGRGDLIVSDALNHASLIDGARLSRADIAVVPHLDAEAVRATLARRRGKARRAFVVTETYFSMDADSPDLRRLRAHCDEHDAALLVDEAHALGVLGPGGRGLCAERGVVPDALVGTYGKAFGAGGAFVAGCRALTDWLWNGARSFVFSTGLSPALAAAALDGMTLAAEDGALREGVLALADGLRAGLRSVGVHPAGFGHIVPWVVGSAADAVGLSEALADAGVEVRPIRPPTVPEGTARLRFTVTARHRGSDIERVVEAVRTARKGSR